MNDSADRIGRWVLLGAGSLDFTSGLLLTLAPGFALPLMGVATPQGDGLIFLRWVGAFVWAVGASYLVALLVGGTARRRHVLEFTLPFRFAAGGFSAAAIGLGWLTPAWISVPLTDFALVLLQVWLLRRGAFTP
jgi:hypothetical protein